jgi:ornithine carbamoyltransferase
MTPRHYLSLLDLGADEARALLQRAIELKAMRRRGEVYRPLEGRVLGMVFEKSSTRTRVSFEAGMAQLGGHAIFLAPRDTHLGRGEPVEDTARVLSRMVDAVMVRTFEHSTVERFAAHSRVPVINALTDRFHPCQILADMQTFVEHVGDPRDRVVAWIGDGNNMCNSFVNASHVFGFDLRVACPRGYEPDDEVLQHNGARATVGHDPAVAVSGADLVVTDVWASMGQEREQAQRLRDFAGFEVNEALVSRAGPDAIVMHCLPAHRGEEISAEVLEGGRSVVWDEAENRLHAQKALLELLLG